MRAHNTDSCHGGNGDRLLCQPECAWLHMMVKNSDGSRAGMVVRKKFSFVYNIPIIFKENLFLGGREAQDGGGAGNMYTHSGFMVVYSRN